MFVSGPNMRFYFASVRWPGAVNDARVLRNSHLCQQWEAGWRPFVGAILLGDSGYPLKSWLMPPIANPRTQEERHFNRAHRKTRRLIECAYGIFKETFQCLKYLRVRSPTRACDIIKACAVLHNFRTPDLDAVDDEDDDDEEDLVIANEEDFAGGVGEDENEEVGGGRRAAEEPIGIS